LRYHFGRCGHSPHPSRSGGCFERRRNRPSRVVPVENAPKLFEAIGSKNKALKIFSTEEGGAEHAHVDNRQVGIDYAADWLAENM